VNFIATLFHRKPSQPLRAVVATKSENLAAQRRRNDVMLQLAVYKAVTTPEQRKAEADAFFARAREPGFEKAVRLGAWDGMAVSPLKVGKA
jgi:hypothetical protein